MSRSALLLGFLVSGIALGAMLAWLAPESGERQPIEWLDKPRGLEEFRLDSGAGPFNKQSLNRRWTIVSFGFMHCPDVCPTSLAELSRLSRTLGSLASPIEFVFVSVDPERDSVSDLGEYVQHFDEGFLGVTGEPEQLTRLSRSLGVQFKVSSDVNDYEVAHSITHSLIGPEGELRGRFRPGFDERTLAQILTSKIEDARK